MPADSHSDCAASRPAPASSPAVIARHLRRRAVGEEVEERERPGEQRGGDGEPGQLVRAEVADHRGVDEQVERLGRERAERRQHEAEDLAVVRGAQPNPPGAARCRGRPGA